MARVFNFRDLFLGSEIIPSRSEFKRLMLTGYLSLICIAVSIVYAILDVSHRVYYALPTYVILFVVPIISLFLIRRRRYRIAKILLMVSVNLVVFWSALNDPFGTGSFLFFIPTGIGSFAILAFHDLRTGLALACFTTILFLVAYFGDIVPFAHDTPSPEYIRISFVLNYFISLTISVLAVYFLMNLNEHSENDLIEKEKFAKAKNDELQKVNEELDRFVYSVSHDLRSPLSSILGLVNIARLTGSRDELEGILKMIEGRVNAQDHFIKEIIDYARNARTETSREPVNLKRLTCDVIESLKYNINAAHISIANRIPDDLTLVSDKIRLTIILSNLIGNSIKYHDLNKKNPFIEIKYDDQHIAIDVTDNGRGIEGEHLEKIFDMFYRGSDQSTGSGLGLFITREAAMKLDGFIEVRSVYGEGSTFSLFIPPASVRRVASA